MTFDAYLNACRNEAIELWGFADRDLAAQIIDDNIEAARFGFDTALPPDDFVQLLDRWHEDMN